MVVEKHGHRVETFEHPIFTNDIFGMTMRRIFKNHVPRPIINALIELRNENIHKPVEEQKIALIRFLKEGLETYKYDKDLARMYRVQLLNLEEDKDLEPTAMPKLK